MDLSAEEFGRFVKMAKKDGVELESDDQYRQMHRDLCAFAELAFDVWKFQQSLDCQLEKEQGGFAFPADGRMCKLCLGGGAGDFWYDKRGMRCMDCQTSYINKIIPGYVFIDKNNKRHITETGLIVRYHADRKDIRRYVKKGILKPRRIEHGQFPATLVFLKRENPNLSVFD